MVKSLMGRVTSSFSESRARSFTKVKINGESNIEICTMLRRKRGPYPRMFGVAL